MKPRDRVLASIDRKPFDRHPIKHLATTEVEDHLRKYFGVKTHNEVLDKLGDDFREVTVEYKGPEVGNLTGDEHGIYAANVFSQTLRHFGDGSKEPLSKIKSISELKNITFPSLDWFDYSGLKKQCDEHSDYARIFDYCGLDFINSTSSVRGYEQTLMDIATQEPVFMELIERRFEFFYQHYEKALTAAEGGIDFIHVADDIGSQQGLLISLDCFEKVFADKYRAIFDLAHKHGAKTMMHVCGSIRKAIPLLMDLGLDVLDVVQTNAVDMKLEDLKKDVQGKLTFAGTMCVQEILPFKSPEKIREEVRKRLDLFSDGGLIIGPSHQIQTDTPIENILAMYAEAGRLKE